MKNADLSNVRQMGYRDRTIANSKSTFYLTKPTVVFGIPVRQSQARLGRLTDIKVHRYTTFIDYGRTRYGKGLSGSWTLSANKSCLFLNRRKRAWDGSYLFDQRLIRAEERLFQLSCESCLVSAIN